MWISLLVSTAPQKESQDSLLPPCIRQEFAIPLQKLFPLHFLFNVYCIYLSWMNPSYDALDLTLLSAHLKRLFAFMKWLCLKIHNSLQFHQMALSNSLAQIVKKEGGSPEGSFCCPYKIHFWHLSNAVVWKGTEELSAPTFQRFKESRTLGISSISSRPCQITLSEHIFQHVK